MGGITNETIYFMDSLVLTSNRHVLLRQCGDADNKGLAKVAVQWLIEHFCFVSSVVLVDSFVLRIRHLRQAPNRYASCSITSYPFQQEQFELHFRITNHYLNN